MVTPKIFLKSRFHCNSMQHVFIHFLEEIKDSEKAFWNYLTFSCCKQLQNLLKSWSQKLYKCIFVLLEAAVRSMLFFSTFFLRFPLGNYDKKSCLNKLKFWEASRNQKRSRCWKFQVSISLGTQKSPSTIQAWAKLNKPFCGLLRTYELYQENWGRKLILGRLSNPVK